MYTIYAIKHNDKIWYVGKTVSFQRRVYEHRYRRKLDKSYEFVILEETESKTQAKLLEEQYIEQYNTVNNGWNKTFGEGTKGVKNRQGDGRFQKGNTAFEARNKKKVLHIETGEIYNSVKECAEKENLSLFGLYKVCNGQNKSYRRQHYQYI